MNKFKTSAIAILTEKVKLEDQLAKQGQSIENWVEEVEEKFDFAIRAQYWFENDPEARRQIFVSLGSKLTLFDKIVRIELEKPLENIEKLKEEEDRGYVRFETLRKTDDTIQIEDYWYQLKTMLPREDSNL